MYLEQDAAQFYCEQDSLNFWWKGETFSGPGGKQLLATVHASITGLSVIRGSCDFVYHATSSSAAT